MATALSSGKPQIVSPVMFDQTMWAEHLAWVGVAYECPSPTKMTAGKLSQALEYAKKGDVQRRISELQKAMVNENGLKMAADIIRTTLDKHK